MLLGRDGGALVAVATIVDEEFKAMCEAGEFSEFAVQTPYYARGRMEDGRYAVVLGKSPDRGNPCCAELVTDLVERFRPEYLILCGIAGGVANRDGMALGDVVVADHVEGYEMQKFVDGKRLRRPVALDHPSKYLRETLAHRVRYGAGWVDRIAAERPGGGLPKVIVGNLIAGEKLMGDGENEYQREILDVFDKAIAVDMESYGLARAVYAARSARHYNLNYLIVRGISDLVAAEHNDEDRKKWRDYAAASAAAFSMSVIDQLIEYCK